MLSTSSQMEGPGGVTIKWRRLSQAPRGEGNTSEKKPHNNEVLLIAGKTALSSQTEVPICYSLHLINTGCNVG